MAWVLITGASSGIGEAFARKCAVEGWDLILVARRESLLRSLAEDLERVHAVKTRVIVADLSNEAGVDMVIDGCKDVSVELLINNAGFGSFGTFSDSDDERNQDMIFVNISALTHLSRYYVSQFLDRGMGGVINVASVAGFFPGPQMAVYYATKAYVLSLSEALAQECSGSDVHVMALCPGPTASEFKDVAHADEVRVFEGVLPTAEDVVDYCLRAYRKKRVVAVHGFNNRFLLFVVRFIPRALIRKIMAYINRN